MSARAGAALEDEAAYTPPSVAEGSFEAMAYRIVEMAAQAAVVVITARLLAPAGRGLYSLASLTAVLCSLPLGSVWSAAAMEVAKRRTPLRELFGALAVISTVGGAAIAVVAIALSPAFGDHWWVVAFPAATAPLILFARYGEGLFQALGHVRAVNLITVGRVVLPLAVITPPLLAGAGPRAAIEIWTVWLVLLPVFIVVPLIALIGRPRRPRERGIYGRLVGTGMKLSVANTALMTSPRIALLALAAFAGDAAVGVYSVAIAVTDALYLLTYAIVSSAFHGIGRRERDASILLTVRSIRHTLLIAAVAGAGLVLVAAFLLPVFVGGGYEHVAGVVGVLIPGVLGLSCYWVLHTFFTVQESRPWIVTRVALITLASNAVLCLALVPPFGLWGAAVATTVANVLSATTSFVRFRQATGVPLRRLVPGRAELRDYADLARSLERRFRRPRVGGARA